MNKLKLLQEWQDHYTKMDNVYEKIKILFDSPPDAKINDSYFRMFDAYTDTLSTLIEDEGNWLNWYAWENQFGTKGLKAKASTWKTARKIDSIEKLVKLIDAK